MASRQSSEFFMSAGVLPIYDGQVYFLREPKGLTDFGGKKEGNETASETAWREAKEEGAFDESNCKKVLMTILNKSLHKLFVCEVDKKPTARERGTTVITMDFHTAFERKLIQFRLASCAGLCALFKRYYENKKPDDENKKPKFDFILDQVCEPATKKMKH
jgi:hypothetical protein